MRDVDRLSDEELRTIELEENVERLALADYETRAVRLGEIRQAEAEAKAAASIAPPRRDTPVSKRGRKGEGGGRGGGYFRPAPGRKSPLPAHRAQERGPAELYRERYDGNLATLRRRATSPSQRMRVGERSAIAPRGAAPRETPRPGRRVRPCRAGGARPGRCCGSWPEAVLCGSSDDSAKCFFVSADAGLVARAAKGA